MSQKKSTAWLSAQEGRGGQQRKSELECKMRHERLDELFWSGDSRKSNKSKARTIFFLIFVCMM